MAASRAFLLWCLLLFSQQVYGLCHLKECNCTSARTGGTASVCVFSRRQKLDMNSSHFPEDLSSVEMSGGKELRLETEVFSKLALLDYVRISFSTVLVKQHSFANMRSTKKVSFVFEDGMKLILEDGSWKSLSTQISVSISRFGQVIIQGKAFAWLSELTIQQVPKLELLVDAFFIEKPLDYPDFTIKSIVLDQVKLENLAAGTFRSLTADVRIKDSTIKRVRSDAFNAISLSHVYIENTTLHYVEAGAFSDRTILHTLTLDRVNLHELESGAVLSGITNLHIRHSRFGVIKSGGFNVTVATASINYNIFNRIHSKGLTLKQWNTLSVNNNTFKKLDPEAFSSQGLTKERPPVINFTRNNLFEIPSNAFDFEVNDELNPSIDSNFFHFKCRCDMSKHVSSMIKPYPLSDTLFQSGLCAVDHLLSKCYDLPEGFFSMTNYTEEKCSPDEVILCEEIIQRDAAMPPIPGIISAVDTVYDDDFEQERRILGSVFIIVLSGMFIMMVFSTIMWIGRNGYCTKARVLLLPSTNSFVNYLTRLFSSSGMTPTGSAHSISRLSIHEYAELQRKIGEIKEEEEVPIEDKATQTLPEELTQELLQSLQEKLNDPENYSEARNMIEHLYDLIKVEESCNKNYKDSASINLDDLDKENENLYDVIVPKRKMSSKNKKETVSIGTRAPSPDKLLPYSVYGETRRLQPAVSDYMEPKDRQVHTYTELPNRTLPDQPSVVCDYGEPTDTRVHLYTELPANIRMANRPLPSKPLNGEALS